MSTVKTYHYAPIECTDCHQALPARNFALRSHKLINGHKKHYRLSFCRLCAYERYKPTIFKNRKKNPQSLEYKRTWQLNRYHTNRTKHKCSNCSNRLSYDNYPYCKSCYVKTWINSTWSMAKKNKGLHPKTKAQIQSHIEILRKQQYTILELPGSTSFPRYRLRHKESIHNRPELAFTLGNIEWRVKR
jgi:hypothetical protein